jgi:hypothetical protein
MHQGINWDVVFRTRSMQQLCDASIELLDVVFSVRFVPRCYKQDELWTQCSGVEQVGE